MSDIDLEKQDADARVSDDKVAKYDALRAEAEVLYKTFGSVECPALRNQAVSFTSEGFNHLIYRIAKQERHKRVQIMRFEMLTKAKELLELTTVIQEYEEYFRRVKLWRNKQHYMANVKVRDWGFFGIIRGFRIKVVVRQIGNGEKKFHSVIPAWTTQYYRDIKLIRNTKGNVADD